MKSAFFAVPEVREGQVQCILAPYIVAKVGPGFAKYVFASGMNMLYVYMYTHMYMCMYMYVCVYIYIYI